MIPEKLDNEHPTSSQARSLRPDEPDDSIQPPTYHVVTESYGPLQIKWNGGRQALSVVPFYPVRDTASKTKKDTSL